MPSIRCCSFFAAGLFFFGEADFFSAKRLFFRAARDARASALTSSPPDFFISFIPQNPPKIHPKSTQNPPQKSKIQINPSPKPLYIYNVYPPPPKKSKKHLPISKKSTNFALAKSQTAHLQPSQSRAKALQKPNCKNFFKKSVKNLHSPNKGCNFASLSAREEIISRERFF